MRARRVHRGDRWSDAALLYCTKIHLMFPVGGLGADIHGFQRKIWRESSMNANRIHRGFQDRSLSGREVKKNLLDK